MQVQLVGTPDGNVVQFCQLQVGEDFILAEPIGAGSIERNDIRQHIYRVTEPLEHIDGDGNCVSYNCVLITERHPHGTQSPMRKLLPEAKVRPVIVKLIAMSFDTREREQPIF